MAGYVGDQEFPSDVRDLNSTPVIRRMSVPIHEEFMTLPPHNLVQSVLQLYEPDDQGFRLSDVTNLYRSGPGPLMQDTFFQSLSSEQQQTLLDDLMNQVRSYASLNDEQQLQAHNMISEFSDFLIYRREAGNDEVQRPRDANWSKEDVFYYSWAMFCSSRKLQAKMGVAKHQALLRDVTDYNERHHELNRALTDWNRVDESDGVPGTSDGYLEAQGNSTGGRGFECNASSSHGAHILRSASVGSNRVADTSTAA